MTHNLSDHLLGPRGEARRVPPARLRASLSGDTMATLDFWWLHVPGTGLLIVHADAAPTSIARATSMEVLHTPPGEPALDTFALGLITLADVPGVRPARRMWPWVTHELIVYTIDTAHGQVTVDDPLPWPLMQPHNLSVQFEVDDDDQARDLLRELVRAIVDGILPPEVQAYVPERGKMMTLDKLHQLWVDTVNTTAEHLRTGAHG